ncbi:hypothetical protein ACTFIZ_009014 [Dictyostelium cf. discoideum]
MDNKIINIYFLSLFLIFNTVLSDVNVTGIDIKNLYAIDDSRCIFDKTITFSSPNPIIYVFWIGFSYYLPNYQINKTATCSKVQLYLPIGQSDFFYKAYNKSFYFVFSQNLTVQCYAPKDLKFELISKYFYNFYKSTYSAYINIVGLDDNTDPPSLITENPDFSWMKISNDFGKFKVTMWGVPSTFDPILFFNNFIFKKTTSIKYNITSPYHGYISYQDSIIDRKPNDYQMLHQFDYPQYWIKLKSKERYPFIFLKYSFFNKPKLVSSDDDGSYNYFINLKPTNTSSQNTPQLILKNYDSSFSFSNEYKIYENSTSQRISIDFSLFHDPIYDNKNIFFILKCNGTFFRNRIEIKYRWNDVSYLPFPFGYGSLINSTTFEFDLTFINYFFTKGTFSLSLDQSGISLEYNEIDGSGPIIFDLNSYDTFSKDDNTVLFRLNYSTSNGILKIELYVFDKSDSIISSIKFFSTDFNIISGDLKNGVLEFLYHNSISENEYFKIKVYDANYFFTEMESNHYYNEFTLLLPQLFLNNYRFNSESISYIGFLFNNVNLTNSHIYNIMYLETYNVKLSFDPYIQITPQWDNITIYGDWVNSRYEFKFFMPPNIVPGAFEYAIGTPSLQYILNTELPDEYQLNVINDRIDLMGPIVTTMNKNPNVGLAFIDNENYNITWTVTIIDYNGFNNGYVVVIGSIDNILYNVSIVSPIEYSKEFTYQVNITLNNNTCISQTYSIAEMVLYDRYGLNSTFFMNKGLDYTPNINPLYSINDKSLFSIETECPAGAFIQPELKSFDFEPKSIDVGSLDRDVTFTYEISIGSGIKEYPIVYLTTATLQVLKCNDVITTQINSTFNQYKCTLTIPYGFGLPQDILVSLYGLIGFSAYFGYSSITLKNNGYPFLIETSFTAMGSKSPGFITGTSSISTEGGSFFIYGRFPPNADFNVEFSQGYSLTPPNKSGSIIKVDGVKSSNYSFNIWINNGNSKSNMYTITPFITQYLKSKCKGSPFCGGPTHGTCDHLSGCTCNWQWEGEDCNSKVIIPQPSKCKGTPICGGATHGTCDDLLGCICNSPWVGVDCNSKVIIVPQPEFNTTSPTIVLNETTTSDNSETNIVALINIVGIREIDYNNKVLHMYSFNKWDYVSNNSKLSTYSSNIINKNGSTTPISVNIEYFEDERTIEFAGQEINMKPSSIKYTIYIDQYPFSTRLSQLQLILSATAIINSDSNSCSNKEFDNTTSESSDYVKLSISNKSLYGRFIRRALVDSTPITISNELLDKSLGAISDSHTSQSFIGINIPIYNKNVIIDPDFSLIINSNPSTTNYNSICSPTSLSGLSKAQLAGIIIGCGVIAIAITIAIVVTIKKKRNLKKEMKIFSNKLIAMK